MSKIQTGGLAVLVVLSLAAIGVSPASASEPEWLLEGKVLAAGEKVDVDLTGDLLFEDMGVSRAVLCEMTGLEFILAKGEDELETFTCNNVSNVAGCTTPVFEIRNLPWLTQLVLSGAEIFNTLRNGGGGTPTFLMECTVLGVKVDDLCKSEMSAALMENGGAGLVTATFTSEYLPNKEEWWDCSVGGAKMGLVEGVITLDALVNEVLVPLSVG